MVKLHVVLSDPGSLSATLTHNKNPAALLDTVINTKTNPFQNLTILQDIKPSSLICLIQPGKKAAQITTCWPVRH